MKPRLVLLNSLELKRSFFIGFFKNFAHLPIGMGCRPVHIRLVIKICHLFQNFMLCVLLSEFKKH